MTTYCITWPAGQFDRARVFEGGFPLGLSGERTDVVVEHEEDLRRNLPGPVMVELYNRADPSRPVVKFESRAASARRLLPLLAALARADRDRAPKEAARPETRSAKTTKVKGRRRGVGELAKRLLRAGNGTDEVIASVRAEFPESRIGRAEVSWYRGAIRREDAAR